MSTLMDGASELATPADDFYLARQPILGRNKLLVAFELLFRSADDATDANVSNDAAATAAVISHASQLGMQQVVGSRMAFLNVDEITLMSDFVRFLPQDRVILEILETVKATPDVVARVAQLKKSGFRFALDDVVAASEDVCTLLDLVDVIKVDLKGVHPDELVRLADTFLKADKKLLAEKVETHEEFERCLELGFDYFQGFYFARPAILTGKKISPTGLAIVHLLEMIHADADQRALTAAIEGDALLSVNLLRLVNTAAAGAGQPIESVGQAIELISPAELQRWLQILLYANPGAEVELNSPLLQMAATRGRLMELVAQRMSKNVVKHAGQLACPDTSFTVGVMSLMDALFSMSMVDILDTVVVPAPVRAALIEREGAYGTMLKAVELLENPRRAAELSACLRLLGITTKEIRDIEMDAFAWVNALANGERR